MAYPTDKELVQHFIELQEDLPVTLLDRNEWNIFKTYNEIILRMGSSN